MDADVVDVIKITRDDASNTFDITAKSVRDPDTRPLLGQVMW